MILDFYNFSRLRAADFFLTHLDKNEKFCYTYDVLNRVTARTVKNATTDEVISTESFTYDAAGNITGGSANTTFVYDTNNRLVTYNGSAVSYDLDGNMLNNGSLSCVYDSANRLISAGGNTYTYNAEDVRIKNVHYGVEEKYTYDTVAELSRLLTRTVGSSVTKYVYGLGLISEETNNTVKVYHFDYRGSTVAITDANGNISDTFVYDTYGKITSRVGNSDIIFCYNGRDGVVTDTNGLFYMRARYYSPDMRRFVNADIIAGEISEAITLNRYAYANGNPVSNVDPFGLSSEMPNWIKVGIGALVISGLAVATVFSGGTTAAILGAALAGSISNGVIGAIIGAVEGGLSDGFEGILDGASSGFMSGTIIGGLTGALSSIFNIATGTTVVVGKAHGSILHKLATNIEAGKMLASGQYSQIGLNKALKTMLLNGSKKPDAIGISISGLNKIIEVVSPKQNINFVNNKMINMLADNPDSIGNVVIWVRKLYEWGILK